MMNICGMKCLKARLSSLYPYESYWDGLDCADRLVVWLFFGMGMKYLHISDLGLV